MRLVREELPSRPAEVPKWMPYAPFVDEFVASGWESARLEGAPYSSTFDSQMRSLVKRLHPGKVKVTRRNKELYLVRLG